MRIAFWKKIYNLKVSFLLQTYEIEFLMHQKWIDHRLAHNHTKG